MNVSTLSVAAQEPPEDEERACSRLETGAPRSQQEDAAVKPLYCAGAVSCVIVVALISATLAILLTNSPPVKDENGNTGVSMSTLRFVGEQPEGTLMRCEGDCDSDAECGANLVCFQRDRGESVPGCKGVPNSDKVDYCIRLQDGPGAGRLSSPTIEPTILLSSKPMDSPLSKQPNFSTLLPSSQQTTFPSHHPTFFTLLPTPLPTDISFVRWGEGDLNWYCPGKKFNANIGRLNSQQCGKECLRRYPGTVVIDIDANDYCWCMDSCSCKREYLDDEGAPCDTYALPSYPEPSCHFVDWRESNRYCSSDLDYELKGPSNPKECWEACLNKYPDLVAINYEDDADCFCQDSCSCMEKIDLRTHVLVIPSISKPDKC